MLFLCSSKLLFRPFCSSFIDLLTIIVFVLFIFVVFAAKRLETNCFQTAELVLLLMLTRVYLSVILTQTKLNLGSEFGL